MYVRRLIHSTNTRLGKDLGTQFSWVLLKNKEYLDSVYDQSVKRFGQAFLWVYCPYNKTVVNLKCTHTFWSSYAVKISITSAWEMYYVSSDLKFQSIVNISLWFLQGFISHYWNSGLYRFIKESFISFYCDLYLISTTDKCFHSYLFAEFDT